MEAYLNMTNYTTVLENPNRYLSQEIIKTCFRKGCITYTDKGACGNGFTFGTLNLPIEDGKVNIIIAPNKGVLMNKEDAINKNPELYNNRVKFFYKESLETNFDDADVLFFVADSFLLKRDAIYKIKDKIDKVLIDESHSVDQQSLYRHFIKDLDNRVSNILNLSNESTSVVRVTATPTHFSKIDIRINNAIMPKCVINHTRDREKALERIKTDLKVNKNVVVFTNSSTLVYKLKNRKGVLEANYIVGDNMKRSLVQLLILKQNPYCNLTIASSRGFEGIDINYKDASVYFFEDRNFDYESFYISNLYQAVNRTRKGAKYIEFCRIERNNKRKIPFNNFEADIDNFISDDFKGKDGRTLSVENKQKSDYKKYKPFLIFNQDSNGIMTVGRDDVAINLFKETILYDKPFPAPEFKKFMEHRNIKLIKTEETQCNLNRKTKQDTKIKNLFANRLLIEHEGLFNDEFTIDLRDAFVHSSDQTKQDFRKIYLRRLQVYLMCKNYSGCYIKTPREKNALDMLSDESIFNDLVKKTTKAFNERSISKYGKPKSKPYRDIFKTKAENTVGLFIIAFANRIVKFTSKWAGNRDYNLPSSVGMDEIKILADASGLNVLEADAVSCYPRLIYALVGKVLPDDFYGKDKKNKVAMNVFINNFFYKPELDRPKRTQKEYSKERFRELGFDEDVIAYLIDTFFECNHRGDLFAKVSFLERRLISEAKSKLQENGFDNCGIVRRHDSVLVFTEKATTILDTISVVSQLLDSSIYLDVDGWFNVTKNINKEGIKTIFTAQELTDLENDLIYVEWKRTKRDYNIIGAEEDGSVDLFIEDAQTYISF